MNPAGSGRGLSMQRYLPGAGRTVRSTEHFSHRADRVRKVCASGLAIGAFATSAMATTGDHYGVTISKAPTQNMVFSNGVYSATGDNAVLNVGELNTSLAAGSVEVTTGNGGGGDEKGDLHVEAVVRWGAASGLTLDAYRSIFIASRVADDGKGPLALKLNDGGKGGFLRFSQSGKISGRISFKDVTDRLTINEKRYTLVADIQTLASAIAADPTGTFALANAYDASQDGHYHSAPIPEFEGVFNGLGNAISNLTIRDPTTGDYVGLFGTLTGAKISSVLLINEVLSASGQYGSAGGLASWAQNSEIVQAGVTGTISSPYNPTGGLLGANENGTVSQSFAIVKLNAAGQSLGGLIGYNQGDISQSWSAGKTVGTESNGLVGNLVGQNSDGTIEDSYATGSVSARAQSALGGLLGYNGSYSSVTRSYSTGAVDLAGGYVGGFAGEDDSRGGMQDCYWDTDTSGTDNGVGGGNEAGVTGLTTAQLQSGLPDGFDPTVWTEKAKINGGLPYLIANPPRQ